MKQSFTLLVLACLCQWGFSQNANSLTVQNGNYTQDFDGMGASGTNYPTNWSGVRASGTGTVNAVLTPIVYTTTSSTGGTYNAGATGDGERALGSLASGSTIPVFGTCFKNNTSSTILSFSLSGVMEQWRTGSNAVVERTFFEYSSINATGLTNGTWTNVGALDLVEKKTNDNTNTGISGNDPDNQTAISGTFNINLAVGDSIWIRWRDVDNTGSDGIYAIDNLLVSYTNGGVDNTPPTVSLLTPTDDATEVPLSQAFSISFSENVQKATGNIYLKKTADGSTSQTLDVATTAVTIAGNKASLSFNQLVLGTSYYIEVDNAAFKDLAGNNFAGITGNTAWNFSTTTTFIAYDFNTCSAYAPVPNGFTQYSVVGDSIWKCTTFGRNSTGGVQMNGYVNATVGNATNEDWLISPALDLSAVSLPLVRFYSINAFAGPQLRLMVSTNYTPGNAPSTASWTELNGKFPAENSRVWTLSDSISMAGYSQPNVYLAWVYYSTTAAAARWTLDDVSIFTSATAPAPFIIPTNTTADLGYVALGSSSYWQPLSFSSGNFTSNLSFTATAPFQLSRDTTMAPTGSAIFTQAEANTVSNKTLYVRFVSDAANKNYTGIITASGTGINRLVYSLTGTSLSRSKSLEIVNWNIEWFGSPDATLGPQNKNLQEANVRKVLRYLDADLYALVEVVDTSRFRKLADSLGSDYGSVVCDYGTRAIDPNNAAYAQNISTAQKEGFIYKKSIFSNITTRPFLKTTNADTLNPSSYYWWSSGRFPYLMEADVTLDGQSRRMTFVLLHAKANTGTDAEKIESYRRRKNGVLNMKDTLDMNYGTASIVILGDYNDALSGTIAPTTGAETVSSYQVLVADSTDANSYKSVTLPLTGTGSTIGGSADIDNVVISNELVPYYINGSAQIRKDVTNLFNSISAYSDSTTDHYPIFSRFYFNPIILPVTVLNLTGSKSGTDAVLNWQVAKEVNVEKYLVEASADGRTFTSIGSVAATNSNSYSFTHTKPVDGNNYYRLKTVDKDGKAAYSSIVRLHFGNGWQVTLSPNPVSDVLYLQSTKAGKFSVNVYDATGRKVLQFARLEMAAGETKQLPVSRLSKGTYTVEVTSGSERIVSKLIAE